MASRRCLTLLVLSCQAMTLYGQTVYCNQATTSSSAANTNKGAQYEMYVTNPFYNTASTSNGTNGFPSYDATYWDTQIPYFVGQTSYVGFATTYDTSGSYRFYGDAPGHTVVNVTLVHRAYLYARTSGKYTFESSYIDDIDLLWVGDHAYSGYNRGNVDLIHTYIAPPQTSRSWSIVLQAGQYLPFRLQFTNAEEYAGLTFRITSPAGAVLWDAATSVDVVTSPCDGSAQFPAVYSGHYVTVTAQQTGTATTTVTSTVVTASGTKTGTVQVLTPLARETASGTPSCAVATPTLSTDGTGNRGLAYGYWNSSTYDSDPYTQNGGFSAYPVNSFDGVAAVHLGVTNRVGFSAGAALEQQPIYGDTNLRFSSQYFTLIHRGYLYARVSGVYTFKIPGIDSILLIWTNQTATAGFTRANAAVVFAATANPQATTYQVTLLAGQYLPLRVQYDNAQNGGTLELDIIAPDGRSLLSNTSSSDIYFELCPGETSRGADIPRFSPWFVNSTVYTTITSRRGGTATDASTVTLALPSGTRAGTVEILTPDSYTTLTRPYSGSGMILQTITTTVAAPSGTAKGTVEVVIPASYTTYTTYYTGTRAITAPVTTVIAVASGTALGTVAVLISPPYTTITQLNPDHSQHLPTTTTIAAPNGASPGTVAVLIPVSYVTLSSTITGSSSTSMTRTLAQPVGTVPGTVVIIVVQTTLITSDATPPVSTALSTSTTGTKETSTMSTQSTTTMLVASSKYITSSSASTCPSTIAITSGATRCLCRLVTCGAPS